MKKPLQGKAYLLLFIMFVAVIIDSCKKDSRTDYENLQKELSETSTAAIIRAKEAFINQSVDNRVQLTGKSLLSDSLLNHRTLLWSEAYTNISGDTVFVFVPVQIPVTATVEQGDLAGTRLTDHLFLRMIDYGNGFKPMLTEMVSMIPDDSNGWNITQKFSGLILLENWYSPFSSFINVLNGKESPHSNKIMSSGGATTEGYFDCKTLPVTLCVGVEGYMNCETHLVTSCQGGGGGGGGGTGGGGSDGGGLPPRGDGPGGGGGGGGSSNPPLRRDTMMNADFFKNAKAMCALNKLMKNNYYKDALNKFIGESKPIDLTFKLAEIAQEPGFQTMGNTIPNPVSWSADNIDVTIAKNLIDNLSSLEVALTLVHEGMHAEILRKLITIHGPSQLNNMNFPSLFNLYTQYKANATYSHEFIARYYVETITYTLKQYDNNKFGDDYYRALSWTGLKGTDVYNNLTDAEKNDIETKKAAILANRNKNNCDD